MCAVGHTDQERKEVISEKKNQGKENSGCFKKKCPYMCWTSVDLPLFQVGGNFLHGIQ